MKPRPSARSAFSLVLTCMALMSTIFSSIAAATAPARARFTRPACTAARPEHQQCFLAYRPQTAVNRAISAGLTGPAAKPQGLSAQDLRAA